jgi:hypothetical protein
VVSVRATIWAITGATIGAIAGATIGAIAGATVWWAWELSEGSVDCLNWDSKGVSQLLRECCWIWAGALGRTD